jgi:predicted TIM-barrel fold metal-dependent hydrolase
MRFNCHSHIFNAKSIFTPYTLDILIKRIRNLNLPDKILDVVSDQLIKIFDQAGDYAVEERLFKKLLKKLTETDRFKELLGTLSSNHTLKLELSDPSNIENFAIEKMVDLFKKIGDQFSKVNKDAEEADIIDFINFLRIALKPSIRDVTDHVMNELKKDDAIIALTMDITKDGKNSDQFENQLKDTSDMVLAYPGRIFPFVAVNPRRPIHLEIMERAITSMGYVGVKLYPSLGYDVDTPQMRNVYNWCLENNVPLLQHCNKGGFNYKNNANKSNPAHWEQILRDFSGLKICFGHFGGGENFVQSNVGDDNWSKTILDLMEIHDGVYADIGYHDDPMKNKDDESIYFTNLKALLSDSRYKKRILFGTDFFMVRLRLRERNHWKWFEQRFTVPHFKQISEINPIDYLGLPKGNREPAWNIGNYIQFVRMHSDKLKSTASAWLEKAVVDQFGPSAALPKKVDLGANWDWNNKAHAYCYLFLEDGQLSAYQKKKPFEAIGRLKMRDLSYWAKGVGTAEIWGRAVESMAEKMDTFFRANRADYRSGYSPPKAVTALKNDFDNGALYLHELAMKCSKIYVFK